MIRFFKPEGLSKERHSLMRSFIDTFEGRFALKKSLDEPMRRNKEYGLIDKYKSLKNLSDEISLHIGNDDYNWEDFIERATLVRVGEESVIVGIFSFGRLENS